VPRGLALSSTVEDQGPPLGYHEAVGDV
jgi:hypothetical protein